MTAAWQLSALLQGITSQALPNNLSVTDLVSDSRAITPGTLFVALPGTQCHGLSFLDQAIANGAVAVITDISPSTATIPVIQLPNLIEQLGVIASRFYGEPSKKLQVIGVTGTNGKSSIVYLLSQLVSLLGEKAAMLGTLGIGCFPEFIASPLTTLDPISLQKQLALLLQAGAKKVFMEVSSHAVAQARIAGTQFSAGIFTNLTRDHLDYHGTMAAYFAAKQRFFTDYKLPIKIINSADEYGRRLAATLSSQPGLVFYADQINSAQLQSAVPYYFATEPHFTLRGANFQLHTQQGKFAVSSPLLGQFNVANILAVIACLVELGYELPAVLAQLPALQPVLGRMQAVSSQTTAAKPTVLVDYAHTPDALIQALKACRVHCSGKLWCVFGCGGQRDSGKRPLMAAAAETYADRVLVTSDNPREESPSAIIADIIAGFVQPTAVLVEPDRKRAIQQVILAAAADDLILIAGKGHETYQLIGKEKLQFSDVDVVQAALNSDKEKLC